MEECKPLPDGTSSSSYFHAAAGPGTSPSTYLYAAAGPGPGPSPAASPPAAAASPAATAAAAAAAAPASSHGAYPLTDPRSVAAHNFTPSRLFAGTRGAGPLGVVGRCRSTPSNPR